MKNQRLWKMLFLTFLAVTFSACEPTQSPVDKMMEEQNQRVYVKSLEDRIIQLVDMMSGTEGEELDIEALEAELAARNPQTTLVSDEMAAAIAEDVVEGITDEQAAQARQEAMLLELRAELDSLLNMYQEALGTCEDCGNSRDVADLEQKVQDAGDAMASTITPSIDVNAAEVNSEELLSPEEVTVVLSIRDLTIRAESLTREKEELFEALKNTVSAEEHIRVHVSERTQAINAELAVIAAERSSLTDELIRLRAERIAETEQNS